MANFMTMGGVASGNTTLQPYMDTFGRFGYRHVDEKGNPIQGPSLVAGNAPDLSTQPYNNPLSAMATGPQAPSVQAPQVQSNEPLFQHGNSTQNEHKDMLDSQVQMDSWADMKTSMKQGLGLFGMAMGYPTAISHNIKESMKSPASWKDSTFSNTAMQASGFLGIGLQDAYDAFGLNPAVDMTPSVSGRDVGGNYGPSSMPNSINDPGAMSAADLRDFAGSMRDSIAASTAAASETAGRGSGGDGRGDALDSGFGGGGKSMGNDPTGGYSVGSLSSTFGGGGYGSREGVGNFGGWGGYDSRSPGTSGGGGGADGNNGAGGSSDSRVICTHFYKKGELSRALWAADTRWTIENVSAHTQRGYQLWGVPYVMLMRRSKVAEAIVRPLALHRANEIAYQLGMRDKPDYIGKLGRVILEGISWIAGWLPLEPIHYGKLYAK